MTEVLKEGSEYHHEKLLTFEEFTDCDGGNEPRYHNMTLLFLNPTAFLATPTREKQSFQKFLQNYFYLDILLQYLVRENWGNISIHMDIQKRLYEAYLILREYGMTNEELMIRRKEE